MYAQMMKGILEGCILDIISHEEVYGYELHARLNQYGFTFVSGEVFIHFYHVCKRKG